MTDQAAARRTRYRAGLSAERRIARDYESRGFSIARRRWRGGAGEIDLIARDRNWIVFVEVKQGRTIARAAERLGGRQMARIMASAEQFLAGEPGGQLTNVRFDAALVDASGTFEIVENAFGQG